MIQNPTRHTLEKAKHDLSEMEKAFQNDVMFTYYLTSFVQAARSITWHMQKQYSKKEGFGECIDKKWSGWYGSKVAEMRGKSELKFLVDARNFSEKEGPIPTGKTREIRIGMQANVIETESKPKALENGTMELLPTFEPSTAKTVNRWFLSENDNIDAPKFERRAVIETCENIIKYFDELVSECEAKFS